MLKLSKKHWSNGAKLRWYSFSSGSTTIFATSFYNALALAFVLAGHHLESGETGVGEIGGKLETKEKNIS